jgi:hypothetical protein
MATATIVEYSKLAAIDGGGVPIPLEPGVPNASSPVTLAATTASSAFADGTVLVRVSAVGATCYVAFGTAPTATAANTPIPDGATFDFWVPKGGQFKVATLLGS